MVSPLNNINNNNSIITTTMITTTTTPKPTTTITIPKTILMKVMLMTTAMNYDADFRGA